MNMELETIAYEYGLELIETTPDGNGYPRNLKKAIIGFNTFEEAEELAERFGLTVQYFKKRDGWCLWHRTGNRAYEPYDYADIMRDKEGHRIYDPNQKEDFLDDLKESIRFADTFEDIQELVVEAEMIMDDFADLGDDEFILVYDGEREGVYPNRAMSYNYDTHHYAIGIAE